MSLRSLVCLPIILLALPAAAVSDKPGCKDHPLFPTRMPDYLLVDCITREFDGYEFFVNKGPLHREEGRFTMLTYMIDDKKPEQSALAVVRNYEAAMKKIGGSIEGLDLKRWVTGKMVIDGKEVWAIAEKGNGRIWLRLIEKQAMEQHIVADATSFANDIKLTGHVAVYGIYFDTGKSEVKPESDAALKEIAKLLAADAALKVWVVGHTDSVGKLEDNLKLSAARADAVVAALTSKHGVAAARLKAQGVGPLAPISTNDTDEGKAKNRRVEFVKQ